MKFIAFQLGFGEVVHNGIENFIADYSEESKQPSYVFTRFPLRPVGPGGPGWPGAPWSITRANLEVSVHKQQDENN